MWCGSVSMRTFFRLLSAVVNTWIFFRWSNFSKFVVFHLVFGSLGLYYGKAVCGDSGCWWFFFRTFSFFKKKHFCSFVRQHFYIGAVEGAYEKKWKIEKSRKKRILYIKHRIHLDIGNACMYLRFKWISCLSRFRGSLSPVCVAECLYGLSLSVCYKNRL